MLQIPFFGQYSFIELNCKTMTSKHHFWLITFDKAICLSEYIQGLLDHNRLFGKESNHVGTKTDLKSV